jgi:hypothetical protein
MRSREGLRVRESDSVIMSSVSMDTTCLVFWKSAVTLCAPVQIEQVSLKYSIKFQSLPSTAGIVVCIYGSLCIPPLRTFQAVYVCCKSVSAVHNAEQD